MDFHSLTRRDLQALCKKNRIPANMTNVAMADALKALQTVEGIEDIQQPTESENFQPPAKTPTKAVPLTPDVSKSYRRSTRRNPVLPTECESKDVEESFQAITRTRRGIATKASTLASRRKFLKEEEQEQEPQESSEILEEDGESNAPETPVARNVGRKRATATSIRRKAETETFQPKSTDTPAMVEIGARTGTRRSTRLMASEKKLFEELPSTRKFRGRKEAVQISDALWEESDVFEEQAKLVKSESMDSINGPSQSHSSELPDEKDEGVEDDQQGVRVTDSASSAEVTDEAGVFSAEITVEALAAVSETYIIPQNGLDQAEGSISETFENVQEVVSESYLPQETEEKCVVELSYEKNSKAEVEGDDVLASEVADDIPDVVRDCSLSMNGDKLSAKSDEENEKPIANQNLKSDGSHAFKAEESVPVCKESNRDQDDELTSVEFVNETERSYSENSKLELYDGEFDDDLNPKKAPSLLISEDDPELTDMSSERDESGEDADEDDPRSSISSLAELDIAEYELEAGLEDAYLDNPETNLFCGEVSVDVLSEGDGDTEHQPLPVRFSLPYLKNPADCKAPEDSENPCPGVKADEQNLVEKQNITLEDRNGSVYTNFARDLAEALNLLKVVQTSGTVCSRIQVISPPRKAITPNSGSRLRRTSSEKKGTRPIKSNGKKKALEPDNKENNSEQSITREPSKMEKLGSRMLEKVKVNNKKGFELLDGKSLRQLRRMMKEATTAEVGRKSPALQPLNENCLSARNN